jgi:hypothetical protein
LQLLKRRRYVLDIAGVLGRAATDRRRHLSVPGARDVMVRHVMAKYLRLYRGRTGNRRKNEAETDRQKTFICASGALA